MLQHPTLAKSQGWGTLIGDFAISARTDRILTMIPKDLLDILVCPACKKPLQLKDDGTSMKCAACRRVYPVRDNIPILLIDEAKVEP